MEPGAGRVGRAHGLDGSFYVRRARAGLLQVGTRVRVGVGTTTIVRRAGTERSPIVRLAGVEDRAGAEALLGRELLVSRAHAPALSEGEWWAHELEGCAVLDGERRVGTVARMIELPSCEALEVVGDEGPALLVPMVRDAILRVDVARGEIEIDVAFLGERG
ncbi:MAG: ribosome maturation factor RimM [Solirubrobacterales bacterium]|nr:ribosome maturation factor RimM [Solirubrobacterales bacterium]